jgi:hypothetical protein
MGLCDAAKALAEGQRAARSATPEWGCATRQKLWPKANALHHAYIHTAGLNACV